MCLHVIVCDLETSKQGGLTPRWVVVPQTVLFSLETFSQCRSRCHSWVKHRIEFFCFLFYTENLDSTRIASSSVNHWKSSTHLNNMCVKNAINKQDAGSKMQRSSIHAV